MSKAIIRGPFPTPEAIAKAYKLSSTQRQELGNFLLRYVDSDPAMHKKASGRRHESAKSAVSSSKARKR